MDLIITSNNLEDELMRFFRKTPGDVQYNDARA